MMALPLNMIGGINLLSGTSRPVLDNSALGSFATSACLRVCVFLYIYFGHWQCTSMLNYNKRHKDTQWACCLHLNETLGSRFTSTPVSLLLNALTPPSGKENWPPSCALNVITTLFHQLKYPYRAAWFLSHLKLNEPNDDDFYLTHIITKTGLTIW